MWVRMQRQVAIVALACLFNVTGCADMYMADAVAAVAARASDSSIRTRFESCPNPRGEGVIVFLRAPTGCVALHSWIWIGRNSPPYVLETAATEVTPGVEAIAHAPEGFRTRVGYAPGTFERAAQETVCAAIQRRQ
jgi:hypothetical protein